MKIVCWYLMFVRGFGSCGSLWTWYAANLWDASILAAGACHGQCSRCCRDGSVFCAVALEELQKPEALYAKLGCKLSVGMPFKDIATVDTILMRALPPQEDTEGRRALKRLQEVGLHVIVPVEHLAGNPMEDAIPLVQLKEASQTQLPEGAKRCASLFGACK